jgi:hypothetical protein
MQLLRERWRPVVGWEGNYEVSDRGRVRSLIANGSKRTKPRILKGTIQPRGYVQFCLTKNGKENGRFGHNLVMEAFVGPKPDGHEVCHWDGYRTNNRLGNLRYGTPLDNYADRDRHGTRLHGEKGPGAKVTEQDVKEIIAALARGEEQHVIAARYGIGQTSVSNIKLGKTWRLLTR